jgi:CBS domain-containing protein
MINLDLVKQFADLKKQLVQNGVYGFHQDAIQVSASELMDLPGVQFESFDSEKFPYRAFVVVNGLKLFGILTSDEMMKYPKPGGYMVEDVNLGGGDRAAGY